MLPDVLYQDTTHRAALRDWVEDLYADAEVTVAVYDRVLPGNATAPFVLLEPATGGGRGGPIMAGDQWAELVTLARCVGVTADQAGRILDQLRYGVAGRDADGAFAVPMPHLGGLPVADRSTDEDVLPDTVSGVPQLSETLRVTLQRGEVAE